MKFNLKDFLELDTKDLFAVNGGYYCTGTSGGSSPSGSKNPGSTQNGGGGHSYDSHRFGTGKKNPDGSYKWVYSDGCEKNIGSPTKKGPFGNSSSSGGYCSGASDGKTVYPNPYYPLSGKGGSSTPSATTTGGSCSSSGGGGTGSSGGSGVPPKETDRRNPVEVSPTISNPAEKLEITGGSFAQITDGSYADELTMQVYKGKADDELMYGTTKDDDGNDVDNTFSKKGCMETGVAKILSEISGKDISLKDINTDVDANHDGELSRYEIEKGMDKILDKELGDIYDVSSDYWETQLTKEKLSELTSADDANTTYVLGFAPECFGGHWVVIEGWSTNEDGQVVLDYDGTSDNDVERTFVLGDSDVDNKIFGIKRIQTYTITQKQGA